MHLTREEPQPSGQLWCWAGPARTQLANGDPGALQRSWYSQALINHTREKQMWFPGCCVKAQGCSRAVSRGKGHWEGHRESSEAQKPPREVRGAQGGRGTSQPRAGAPWVLQSIAAQSRACEPPGPAQGCPVSHWRCFPRRGLRMHCPAAWKQLLRITNAANNSQEATGPQP